LGQKIWCGSSQSGFKIGFKDLKLNRLEAAINLDNLKSIQLAKAIGMHKEGIKRDIGSSLIIGLIM
jgi:RimJ/RimL family protein N-acetyltransferase